MDLSEGHRKQFIHKWRKSSTPFLDLHMMWSGRPSVLIQKKKTRLCAQQCVQIEFFLKRYPQKNVNTSRRHISSESEIPSWYIYDCDI